MPQSRNSPANDPAQIAQHAIRRIESRLQKDGLKVRMGVELEFSIHFKPDAPCLQDTQTQNDPLQLGDSKTRKLFPHSKLINYAYREAAYGKHLRQYEVVTDHDHPIAISQLPRAIDLLRTTLLDGKIFGSPNPTQPRLNLLHHERTKNADWRALNVEQVSFGSDDTMFNTNGLHLNFSLQHLPTSKPLKLGRTSSLKDMLVSATQQLFERESTLIATTPSQQMRWRMMENSTGKPDVRGRAIGSDPYIENKAPGADCNAAYAVLLQMAAIYKALHVAEENPSLETILNDVEPELGTRFLAAANAKPELKTFQLQPQKGGPAQG